MCVYIYTRICAYINKYIYIYICTYTHLQIRIRAGVVAARLAGVVARSFLLFLCFARVRFTQVWAFVDVSLCSMPDCIIPCSREAKSQGFGEMNG